MRSGNRDEQLLPLDLLFPKWCSISVCVCAADNKCETICFAGNETTYSTMSVCFCIYTSAKVGNIKGRTHQSWRNDPDFRRVEFIRFNFDVLIKAEIRTISTVIFRKHNINRDTLASEIAKPLVTSEATLLGLDES